MNFLGIKSTSQWSDYWIKRKADWKTAYLDTYDHPHRRILVGVLKRIPWVSLLEIGCNSAPNLMAIIKNIPGKQVGGIDVNADAIELCNQTFRDGFFKVNSADDIMMSDKSVDVVLSDMTLIYVSPRDINRYVAEIKRIGRNYVVLCEFHSKNIWQRLRLKLTSGYNAYDWKKLLDKHGFYDIQSFKLKPEDWPGGNPQKTFAYIIVAKIPSYKN